MKGRPLSPEALRDLAKLLARRPELAGIGITPVLGLVTQ